MQESIRRNTVFALAVRVSGALFTGVLTIFLVRTLGPTDFGVFSLAVGVTGLLLLAADFGISNSSARFIAERQGNRAETGGTFADALALKLAIGLVVSLLLVLSADTIANAYGAPEMATPLRWMAIALMGQSVLTLVTTAFTALGRNSISFRLVFCESAVETSTSIALVLLGTGVAGASAGRAIGFAFGGVLGLILIARVLGRRHVRLRPRPFPRVRKIARYASALVVVDSVFAVFSRIDVLLIGAFLGVTAAGLYAAPLRLIIFAQFAGLALAGGVAPRLARRAGREPNVAAFQTALRFLIPLQLVIVAPLLVWADPIMLLTFGSEYSESALVLQAFVPYIFLMGLAPPLSVGVNYVGEARRRIPIAIAALLANLTLDLILIPRIGIVAGAIGSDVGMLIYVYGHLRICRDSIGLRLAPLANTFARSLAAAGAMALTLVAFGTGDVGFLTMIVGALTGITVYAATLLLLSEFSARELTVAKQAVRTRLSTTLRRSTRLSLAVLAVLAFGAAVVLAANSGDPGTAPVPGRQLFSDSSARKDPFPLWGAIDCEAAGRARTIEPGGDPGPEAGGAPQENNSFRRLTVIDGDSRAGESCELGLNDHRSGPTAVYREGERLITYISLRLPAEFPLDADKSQNVVQIRQAEPSDSGETPPVLALSAQDGRWILRNNRPGPVADSSARWSAPAQTGIWTRFALYAKYSRNPAIGWIKIYVDLNADGDFADADEQSDLIRTSTLAREIADPSGQGVDTDGFGPGDSLPSHLRVGIDHDPGISCPAPGGCAIEVDNVQVARAR